VNDQHSDDDRGWARFSNDELMRYRLARSLDGERLRIEHGLVLGARCVFVMLNPSTADAFVGDPTVRECIERARQLRADVLEVVNLFALRSPYPAELRKRAHGLRGDDAVNDAEILAACLGARIVIAAWGNHGELGNRAYHVRQALRAHRVELHHLGTTQEGYPKHPLARGKHRIPRGLQPIAWSTP